MKEILGKKLLNKNKNSKAKGCLNYFIGSLVFVFVFLMALIPQFEIGIWSMSANSSRAKNVLVEAIKDCLIKNLDGIDKPTFEDIGLPEMPPHTEWPQDTFSFYTDFSFSKTIQESDSCFSLAAKPSTKYYKADELTWFSIKFDPKNNLTTKKCGDSDKKHCEKGNTW